MADTEGRVKLVIFMADGRTLTAAVTPDAGSEFDCWYMFGDSPLRKVTGADGDFLVVRRDAIEAYACKGE